MIERLATVSACLVLLAATRAAAQSTPSHTTPTAQLVLHREPGTERCPDEAELRETVAARLGFDPIVTTPARRIVVTFRRSNRMLQSRVELLDESGAPVGARAFVSTRSDCSDLAATTALAVSIAIDPLATVHAPPHPNPLESSSPSPSPAPSPPPVAASSASSASSALPPPSVSPPRPTPHRVGPRVYAVTSLGGGIAIGTTPSATLALWAGLALGVDRFAIGLEGRIDLPQTATVAGLGTVAASLVVAGIVPCFRQPFGGRFVLHGCAVGYGGALQGSSSQTTGVTPYVAIGVRPMVDVVVAGPLSFRATTEVTATLATTRLQLHDAQGTLQPVWSTPPVAFLGGISAVLSFL